MGLLFKHHMLVLYKRKKIELYKAYGMFCSSSISLIINSSHANGKQVFTVI